MFRELHLSVKDRQYTISAQVIISGRDIVVVIGGGTDPHVGAVAVGHPQGKQGENGESGISSSLIDIPGHREAELAREAAERLAATLGVTVVVAVGIHIDHATKEEINILVDHFNKLIEKIEERLAPQMQ